MFQSNEKAQKTADPSKSLPEGEQKVAARKQTFEDRLNKLEQRVVAQLKEHEFVRTPNNVVRWCELAKFPLEWANNTHLKMCMTEGKDNPLHAFLTNGLKKKEITEQRSKANPGGKKVYGLDPIKPVDP